MTLEKAKSPKVRHELLLWKPSASVAICMATPSQPHMQLFTIYVSMTFINQKIIYFFITKIVMKDMHLH